MSDNILQSALHLIKGCEQYVQPNDLLPLVCDVSVNQLMIANCWVRENLWDRHDYELANEYAERIEAGETPPAILIGKNNDIFDGHHRLYAAHLCCRKTIKAIGMYRVNRLISDRYDWGPPIYR